MAAQTAIKTVLAREADTSTDAVYLTLNAGSVIVEAELYFATADGATFAVSQLLAGIFASPSALENALNMQFERDLVGVTASVQQILVAPEYGGGGGMAVVVIGAAAGGVVAVLVLFRGLFRKRRKVHATRPSQEQELGSVVNTQVVSGTAADVPMGMPVQQEQQGWFSDAVNAIESATGIDDFFNDKHMAIFEFNIDVFMDLNGAAFFCGAKMNKVDGLQKL